MGVMWRVGSLFSGCGGLDLGLHYAGLGLEWACESDPSARAVFTRHWPAVPIATDVRLIDDGFPRVDVLAGGFPCQDVSQAGGRAGLAAGTRSGLWREYARAVRILRPRVVIVENVTGLLTAGFGVVLADLAAAGYDARWACLRSADLGAPHGRDRVYIVATNRGATPDARGERSHRSRGGDTLAQASGRREWRSVTEGPPEATPAASGSGRRLSPAPNVRPEPSADADGEALSRRLQPGMGAWRDATGRGAGDHDGESVPWGHYEPAIRLWEQLTRPAPRPTDDQGRLEPRFVEWMMGFPDGWTEGVSRSQRLRMLGNAVQVQSAELIGHAARSVLS